MLSSDEYARRAEELLRLPRDRNEGPALRALAYAFLALVSLLKETPQDE